MSVMRKPSTIWSFSAAAALAMGMLTAGPASADVRAADWPNDTYYVCADYCDGATQGGVVWGNRTSKLQGWVEAYNGTATVKFDAFAGSTKVDSDSRTSSGPVIPYNFYIGDPDRPGGVDRIRVQVCAPRGCGEEFNLIRN